jgi:hypothetical protein
MAEILPNIRIPMTQYHLNFVNSIHVELLSKNYQEVLFGDLDNFTELSNGQYIAHCPICKSNSRQFSIAPDKPVWCCFNCYEKGNWIQYLQKKEGLSYKQALGKLVEAAALLTQSKG